MFDKKKVQGLEVREERRGKWGSQKEKDDCLKKLFAEKKKTPQMKSGFKG